MSLLDLSGQRSGAGTKWIYHSLPHLLPYSSLSDWIFIINSVDLLRLSFVILQRRDIGRWGPDEQRRMEEVLLWNRFVHFKVSWKGTLLEENTLLLRISKRRPSKGLGIFCHVYSSIILNQLKAWEGWATENCHKFSCATIIT